MRSGCVSICVSNCAAQLFFVPHRTTMASDVPKEISLRGEGQDCIHKAV